MQLAKFRTKRARIGFGSRTTDARRMRRVDATDQARPGQVGFLFVTATPPVAKDDQFRGTPWDVFRLGEGPDVIDDDVGG